MKSSLPTSILWSMGNVLLIQWKRLVVEGDTCTRCRESGEQIKRAVEILRKSLSPIGIKVDFEEQELTYKQFLQDPLQSNQILINGKLLEEWIGAKTVHTPCCEVCGGNECRAVEIESQIYETIDSELIIKAGLKAAAELTSMKNTCCTHLSCSCG